MKPGSFLLLVALVAPLSAGAQEWTVGWEIGGGFMVPTRNLGLVLGSEVAARIETDLSAGPLFTGGIRMETPYPRATLRGSLSYFSTTAVGQPSECVVLQGPGCQKEETDAAVFLGMVDVILHPEDSADQPGLTYFSVGLGVRSFSFDEPTCPQGATVCSVMQEFLTNQVKPVGRLGLGYRQRKGQFSWGLEALDFIGPFTGTGFQAEGGIQNDLVIAAHVGYGGW